MGSFDRGMAAALPVGSVIQSPLNLEAMTNGQFIALDGRDCNRSDYPLIQSQFPAGVFTSTARTLAAAPAAAVITADAGNFYAAGVSSASSQPLQCSTDGVSWTASPTAGISGWASVSTASVILAGPRVVVAGGGPACVIAANTNPTLLANWTATTGGTTTTLTQGLAYGSTANGGSGRTVLVKNGSLATASGIFYLNDGSTAWSAASGGSTMDRAGVVWTGSKFICLSVIGGVASRFSIQTSSDGATWADGSIPKYAHWGSGQTPTMASDGNGTVVIAGYQYLDGGNNFNCVFVVSKDHGTTWRIISAPADIGSSMSVNKVQFVNGKFFAGTNGICMLVSADGVGWTPAWTNFSNQGCAFKSGVYCTVPTTTSAATHTEDLSKFAVGLGQVSPVTVGASRPNQSYIKVRS